MQIIITIIYLPCFLLCRNNAIRIFRSTANLEVGTTDYGLRYKKPNDENVILSNSLTVCIRFNAKILAKDYQTMKLFAIGSSKKYGPSFPSFSQMSVRPTTWFEYGNQELGCGYKAGWILRDPVKNSYMLWIPDYWHHICFAYSKPNFHVSFVKVSE